MSARRCRVLLGVVLVFGGACGEAPKPPVALGSALALVQTPSEANPAVATVNGAPVLASCVREQTWATTPQAALDACIETELLAQQAAAWLAGNIDRPTPRVIASIAEAQAAFRGALADQMERLYSKTVTSASDLPPGTIEFEFDALSRKYDQDGAQGFTRPEFRAYRYLRINVAKGAAAAVEDLKAKAAIDEIYKRFAGRRDILGTELQQAVDEANPAWGIDPKAYSVRAGGLSAKNSLEKAFANALFGLPAPGSLSPPVRTPWGWDLVYLDNILPSQHFPRAQIIQEMFPRLRQAYFAKWVTKLAADRGLAVAIHEDVLGRIGDLGR